MNVEIINKYGIESFVFTVHVDRGIVKMSCNASDESIIVLIDRFRFEDLWYKIGKGKHYQCYIPNSDEELADLSRGTKEIWMGCGKYPDAEKGFAEPFDNPVSVAQFTYTNMLRGSAGWVDANGFGISDVTRTIWLLANGAKEFPVIVNDLQSAIAIHDLIGVKTSKVYTGIDLYERARECITK